VDNSTLYEHGAGKADWNGVYESEFSPTPEELAALRRLIADIGFSNMKNRYHPLMPGIRDGDVCTFIVVRGGETKRIVCNNAFPRGLWRLREMAFKILPAAHAREIEETGRKVEFNSTTRTYE